MPKAKKPACVIEYGNVKVVVWGNKGEKGVFYNCVPSKRRRVDDKWTETPNFGVEDLLPLGKALNEAHSFVHREMAKNKMKAKETEGNASE